MIAAALALLILAQATHEYEHPPATQSDPYVGMINPKTGKDCCKGSHCRPVRGDLISEGVDYYEYQGLRIQKDETESSFDGRWHICIYDNRIQCMRVPGSV